LVANVRSHSEAADDLAALVEFSGEAALSAFTANVSTALRLSHKGRIGIGMDAGLV